MDRKFSLLHLSLIQKTQPQLTAHPGNREEWLRFSLRETFEFPGWGKKKLVWLPKKTDEGLIFGLIQGVKPHQFHKPPSAGGDETEGDFWQGAYLFLDPSHHDDGQKLAIENDILGKPRALSKSLFDYINNREDAPYSIKPELIFDADDFWRFSQAHNNRMRYISFRFVVPNMWGPQNDLEEDLKETGKETGSEQVDVTLRANKNGVGTENEIVKNGVTYAAKGAGRITARSMDGKPFSSKKRATTVTVPADEVDTSSDQSISTLGRRILNRG